MPVRDVQGSASPYSPLMVTICHKRLSFILQFSNPTFCKNILLCPDIPTSTAKSPIWNLYLTRPCHGPLASSSSLWGLFYSYIIVFLPQSHPPGETADVSMLRTWTSKILPAMPLATPRTTRLLEGPSYSTGSHTPRLLIYPRPLFSAQSHHSSARPGHDPCR